MKFRRDEKGCFTWFVKEFLSLQQVKFIDKAILKLHSSILFVRSLLFEECTNPVVVENLPGTSQGKTAKAATKKVTKKVRLVCDDFNDLVKN